ncbi:nucleoside-triphosphatase [Nonomuraea wenchangensis]|uniref:nucleoside-triphosphatase n=1 Tax=Nonomuraea wenchangensis TaxID=568860 RepID=UPI00331811CC
MGRALLFTGAKKVGKTTALKSVVAGVPSRHKAGFFATERRVNGTRVAFEIEMLDGRSGSLASIDSDSELRVGRLLAHGRLKYGVDLDFLDGVAVPELRASLANGTETVLVIDEIGPMQLYSEAFRQVVIDALASPCLILGTIMSPAEPWVDELKEREEVETFHLTLQNRDTMTEMMSLYLTRHVPRQAVTRPT